MNKRKSITIIGAIILLLLMGLVVDSRARFPMVNRIIITAMSPVTYVVTAIADGVHNTTGYFASLSNLKAENEKLQKEINTLRQDNIDLIAMKAENERLSQLLNFKQQHPQLKFQPAKVIGRDIGDLKDTILINQGSNAGLKLNMSVVTGAGLVGIVDSVYPNASRILLINSPRSKIGGMNLRGDSRVAGIVGGLAGQDASLEMNNMARDADLLPGDTVVTSGYSGHHPAGLIIGTIEEVQKDDGGLTKVATITPSVDFSRLEEVMVVTNYDDFSGLLQDSHSKVDVKKKIIKGGAVQ
jgi:rod shape-determining protein MreC